MIAIDVGYGHVKAISAADRAIFPAAVAPRRAAGELGGALGASAPRHAVDVHRDSADAPERYWVGQAALDAGAGRTWTEASARTGYDILILAGAALTGVQGQTDLALGLPLGVWVRGREERQALRERLEGLGAWVTVECPNGAGGLTADARPTPPPVSCSHPSAPAGRRLGMASA